MPRQGLGVHLVELRCERQSHAQHVRLTALDEVLPSGQILEGGHGEALRAGEGDKGQAVLRSRPEALAANKVNDDA